MPTFCRLHPTSRSTHHLFLLQTVDLNEQAASPIYPQRCEYVRRLADVLFGASPLKARKALRLKAPAASEAGESPSKMHHGNLTLIFVSETQSSKGRKRR